MADFAIATENLTKHFGPRTAVDGLTIDVPVGAIFGFLGPNGAGKTTTINLLLGLLEPSEGSARVLGLDCLTRADEVRANVGALLEHPGVYDHMTAEDNLEFYGRIWGLPTEERRARTQELLSRMNLWDRGNDLVGHWSRGMKQKLALARAMLHRPSLLFLDEPTAGLDVVSANDIRAKLERLAADEGATVFLTTHNMAEAERLCSLVAVIREGALAAIGHPDELRDRATAPELEVIGSGFTPEIAYTLAALPGVVRASVDTGAIHIGLEPDADVPTLVQHIISSGGRVEEMRRPKASLEDVFLRLVEEETGAEGGAAGRGGEGRSR